MKKEVLLRYTSLPVLLDILTKQKLTLLDPASWDDRNDCFYIKLYKEMKPLKTLLAICFTTKPETYHHWKVFSDGLSGICIHFNKEILLNKISPAKGIKCGSVDYHYIKNFQDKSPDPEKLPFLKRRGFKDEEEFRIIYELQNSERKTKSVEIELESIDKIVLSPWIPKSLSKTVKSVINSIKDCSEIHISRSFLIDSPKWQENATRKHRTRKPSPGRQN